jgi:Mn-dependent DtxR family transcriptional regulator
MKEQIGETAGTIWKVLHEKGEIAISQLPKILDQKSVLVHQALGWLAREDKIHYRTEANRTYVSLTGTERRS